MRTGLRLRAFPSPSLPFVLRASARWESLSLATRFLVANLVTLVLIGIVLGLWVGRQIEVGVLTRTASVTALYVDSIVAPQLQQLSTSSTLDDQVVSTLDNLLTRTDLGQRIVSLKIWRTDGTILYSPVRSLIGRRFPVEGGLTRALNGEVSAEMTDLSEVENEFERTRWSRLVEIYVPVRADRGANLIAVMEVYQLPNELDDQIRQSQLLSWAVVSLAIALAYMLLAGIVRTGSDTIARQAQTLRARVDDLQRVLAENRRLQTRVAQAARRSTTLNERSRRRIGADLHDGPGQALALALLRLEDGPGRSSISEAELTTVRSALQDALADLRAIAADLRMPSLAALSVTEVVQRAVRDHQHHAGGTVRLILGDLPREAPMAIKIALLRTLQEALSNAARHGGGRGVVAHVWSESVTLHLVVRDEGPGFDLDARTDGEHLGIAGMRERTELLGGSFAIESTVGRGTTIRASWPLVDVADEQ